MSEIKVDKISPQSGTALAVGDSGDTITIPSGATITNSGTANGFGGGKVLQVVSTTKTDTWTSSTASWVDVTGFSVDITPSATNSKILVIMNTMISQTGVSNRAAIRLMRDNTAISVGDAASARTPGTGYMRGGANYDIENVCINYLDSPTIPSTPIAITYKIQGGVFNTNSMALNRDGSNDDSSWNIRTASTITVQEIGA